MVSRYASEGDVLEQECFGGQAMPRAPSARKPRLGARRRASAYMLVYPVFWKLSGCLGDAGVFEDANGVLGSLSAVLGVFQVFGECF